MTINQFLFSLSQATQSSPPVLQIHDNGGAPIASYNPNDILIRAVYLLVFSPGGDKRKIAGRKVVTLKIRRTEKRGVGQDGAVARGCVDDGV